MTNGAGSRSLHERRDELQKHDDHIRDMIEQLILLDDLGYSALDRDAIADMMEVKRGQVLRELRDVEQELDHAFRR